MFVAEWSPRAQNSRRPYFVFLHKRKTQVPSLNVLTDHTLFYWGLMHVDSVSFHKLKGWLPRPCAEDPNVLQDTEGAALTSIF